MGQLARALGIGAEFDFEGVTYRLSPPKPNLQAKFETWLEKKAWEVLKRQKQFMEPDEYRSARTDLLGSIAASEYDFGGELVRKSINGSLEGLTHWCWILLHDTDPTVEESTVRKMVEAEVMEILAALERNNPDPTLPPTPTVATAVKELPS